MLLISLSSTYITYYVELSIVKHCFIGAAGQNIKIPPLPLIVNNACHKQPVLVINFKGQKMGASIFAFCVAANVQQLSQNRSNIIKNHPEQNQN